MPANADDLQRRIREADAKASDSRAPLNERREALDKSIEARRALAPLTTDPMRRGPLLLEQADAIQRRLALDGWDSTAVVGILPRDTRDSLLALAREGADAAARADEDLRQATAAVESGRAPKPDAAAFDAMLAQRDRRAPVALARAALVLAGFTADNAERQDLAKRALAALENWKESDAERDARRLLLVGLARRALAQGEQAIDDLQRVAASSKSPAVRMEATLGAALAMLESRGPAPARAWLKSAMNDAPFVMGGKPAALAQMLAADVLFAIGAREALAAPEGPARDALWANAYAPMLAILERDDLGLTQAQRQSVVFHRLNAVSPDDAEALSHLPAMVALAKGSLLMFVPGQFDNALATLESITQKDSPRMRELGARGADALLAVYRLRESEAKAWGEDPRLIPAIDALRRLAREYPDSAHAKAAIANAASLAQGLVKTHPEDAVFGRLYADTLADAVALFPEHESADAWRTELSGRLLRDGKVAEGLAMLDGVRSETLYGLFAEVAAAQTAGRAAMNAPEGASPAPLARDALARTTKALARVAQEREAPTARREGAGEPPNLDRTEATIRAYRAGARFLLRDYPGALEDAASAHAMAIESDAGLEASSVAMQTKARAQAALGRDEEALKSIEELLAAFAPLAQAPAVELCDAATERIAQAERARDQERALRIARETLVPAARLGLSAAEKGKTGADDAWKVQLAEALCRAEQEQSRAVELLEEIMVRRGPDDRTLLWLAEARLALGDKDKALILLRDLIQSIEQKQSSDPNAWRAWSRIMPLIAEMSPTPEQALGARQRIALLRLKDGALGGEPFASRILAADVALAPIAAQAPGAQQAPQQQK